jgi:phage major head subunit gpT-like protein
MSAQYPGNAGVMDTPAYASLYSKTFDQVVKKQEAVPKQGIKFVTRISTNLESFKIGQVSSVLDLPVRSTDTDKIRLITPVEGHNKTISITQFRTGIIVTRTAVESQYNRQIAAMMTGLPASADRKLEYAIAGLFNNGFASETTGDGSYVFSASHYHEDPEAGTFSNLLTAGGFTTANYALAWIRAQSRTNEKGFPDPFDIDEIVYPPAIHEAVMQVLKSPKVAENALNAVNAFAGDAKATKYNWLTSTTAWFAHVKRMGGGDPDDGFLLVERVKPEYTPISDSMNPEIIMGKRLRMAFGVGALHADNWLGNAGA